MQCHEHVPKELLEIENRRLRANNARLLAALQNMLGWALYAEECDSYYFAPDSLGDARAAEWKQEVEQAKSAITEAEKP